MDNKYYHNLESWSALELFIEHFEIAERERSIDWVSANSSDYLITLLNRQRILVEKQIEILKEIRRREENAQNRP